MGYHRGDAFEEMINISNIAYEKKGIALIQKIATPMKPIRKGKHIVSAYYEEKSTLDFIGVANGKAIAFDAKETKEKNKFPLSNIREHQIKYMRDWFNSGGITFLVINFKELGKTYRIDWCYLSGYWEGYQANKGKRGYGNIPIEFFQTNCLQIKSKDGILLDYLKGIV